MGAIESVINPELNKYNKLSSRHDSENKIYYYDNFLCYLSRSNRKSLEEFINYFQDQNRCQITRIEAQQVKDDVYQIFSIQYQKTGRDYLRCTGISSRYNNLKQIHFCDCWYINFEVY